MTGSRPDWRVGWGLDVHQLGGEPPILLAGVEVDLQRGVIATSDGDVVAHAVADALLGAATLGDLGTFFPSSDPKWENADSMGLLRRVVEMADSAEWQPSFCDVTAISESVRVAPFREKVRAALAGALGVSVGQVSVKATTTDGLGWIGRDQGIAAVAAVTVVR
ncbi:MAG: 2-C-methyl-D-erythritol 2,4-cyclodiphosphate synthase [bacterium]|nr:2-C-methyl-D-erythritol 2,4-cyclodiphosphate synthase [bacterium]MDE0601235.1 2-C-methyl-D-erythritol 2,4-cyclodiphosphate synthase [bacterium]